MKHPNSIAFSIQHSPSPCLNCESRCVGCHSKCETYLNWKSICDEHREEAHRQNELNRQFMDSIVSSKEKALKRMNRRGKI